MKTAVTPGTRRRGRHRASGAGRGWGPRALLSAMAAPLGVVAGVSAAVAGALVDQVVVAGVGTALAGAPGLLHLTRARAREQRLAARRARALSAPIPPLVWDSVVDTVPEPEPMPAPEPTPWPEPVPSPEPMPSPEPTPSPDPGPAPVPDPVPDPGPVPDPTGHPDQPVVDLRDERVDTGELQRIWDLGEGPDTGPLPVIPDVPVVSDGRLVTEAPHGKQAVLARGLAGTTQVLAPVLARRQRQRAADDQVLDAMVRAESQEQARRDQAARRRGRRAAPGPVDRPPLALTTGTSGGRRAARSVADAAPARQPVG